MTTKNKLLHANAKHFTGLPIFLDPMRIHEFSSHEIGHGLTQRVLDSVQDER